MKLYVVTGFAGFIGSHLTRELLDRNCKVYGIDRFTRASNGKSLLSDILNHENFQLLEGDICHIKDLPDCDCVINVAAETHVGNSIIDDSPFVESNIRGVQNLLQILRKKPKNIDDTPLFFHFSTDEVYGDIVSGSFNEDSPLNPSNPYAASKAAADMLIKSYKRTYDIDYIILRPTNNYGTHQYPEKFIPVAVKLLSRNKKIRLHNKGEPIRNWLHVSDTVSAVMTILKSGTKNEIYNVSGNKEQKNIITAKGIVDSYFNEKPSSYENFLDFSYERVGQDVRYSVDDSKLKSLGWNPIGDFDKELAAAVKFYKKNFVW